MDVAWSGTDDTQWSEQDGELLTVPKDLIGGKKLVAAINEPSLLEECFQAVEIRGGSLQDTLLATLPGNLLDKLAMDDLNRESVFMEQTALSVSKVVKSLHQMGIPYQRPEDYFAEMVKDDKHMEKVQQRLMEEKERLDRIERKKEEREAAKLAKQVQLEREKEKKRKAKQFQENVEKLQKQRKKKTLEEQHDDDDDDFPVELLQVEEVNSNRMSGWSAKKKKRKPKVAMKRGIVKKTTPKGRYFSKNKSTPRR